MFLPTNLALIKSIKLKLQVILCDVFGHKINSLCITKYTLLSINIHSSIIDFVYNMSKTVTQRFHCGISNFVNCWLFPQRPTLELPIVNQISWYWKFKKKTKPIHDATIVHMRCSHFGSTIIGFVMVCVRLPCDAFKCGSLKIYIFDNFTKFNTTSYYKQNNSKKKALKPMHGCEVLSSNWQYDYQLQVHQLWYANPCPYTTTSSLWLSYCLSLS